MSISKEFLAEVNKAMVLHDATEKDIMRVTGWKRRTFKSRFQDPDTIRFGEASAICSYLNISLDYH